MFREAITVVNTEGPSQRPGTKRIVGLLIFGVGVCVCLKVWRLMVGKCFGCE